MGTKMKLRETHIDLVGLFDCTIENNTILSAGAVFHSEPPHDTADMFLFHVWNGSQGITKDGIAVVFRQVGEEIEFRYRKDVFEVMSVSFDLIELRKDGKDYFIKRLLEIPS